MSAGVAEPRNADAFAEPQSCDAGAQRIDAPHDFMSRHNWTFWFGQFTVDDMQISAANAAGFDLQAYFAGAGRGHRARLHYERRMWRIERHRRHGR
jgi:hypothetical protein